MTDTAVRERLAALADKYETSGFLSGDPSWFMHQVEGIANQEATAFVASSLSYGRRDQFMPRMDWLLERSGGEMDAWIRSGNFSSDLAENDPSCFYRLFTRGDMHSFLMRYRSLLLESGTLGGYLRFVVKAGTGIDAVAAICAYFGSCSSASIIPKDTQSACKRVCMFLRWMVRDSSPVDLGLWSDFIDKRTLIMPLDTHVLQMAAKFGLLSGRNASMSAARKLTAVLAGIFPDDPLKGDFALFGAGVAGEE